MKYLLLTIVLFAPLLLSAQIFEHRNGYTHDIDSLVKKINTPDNKYPVQSLVSENSANAIKTKSYSYTLNHGKLNYIDVKFKTDSTDYEEKYYMDNGSLIYAEQNESYDYSGTKYQDDWRGKFYFSNWKLIYDETSPHGKSEKNDWDPQKEILRKYDLRVNELSKEIKLKKK